VRGQDAEGESKGPEGREVIFVRSCAEYIGLTFPESALAPHQAHGEAVGSCGLNAPRAAIVGRSAVYTGQLTA